MIELSDAELQARVTLATEMILTSGVIEADDIARGWYDKPDPTNEMQRVVILLAVTIICGGIGGAPIEDITAAWKTPRLLTASIEALLTAVENIRADNQEATSGA